MNPDQDAWLRRFHTGPAEAVRLVCFPHAGGSASFFHPLSARLSHAFEVWAVQYPGRQDRRTEPCPESITAYADAIVAATRSLTGRPLAFLGHSMGAIIAYEVALRQEAAGAPPLLRLFASGRRAPSRRRSEHVHRYDDDRLVEELSLLNGAMAEMLRSREIRDMVLPAVRSDYRAIETYEDVPGRSVAAPITVLLGDSDPRVTAEDGAAWAGHTSGAVDVRVLPGGHFFISDRTQDVVDIVTDRLLTRR